MSSTAATRIGVPRTSRIVAPGRERLVAWVGLLDVVGRHDLIERAGAHGSSADWRLDGIRTP